MASTRNVAAIKNCALMANGWRKRDILCRKASELRWGPTEDKPLSSAMDWSQKVDGDPAWMEGTL